MSMSAVIESIEREAFEYSTKTQRYDGLYGKCCDRLDEHRCTCGRLLGRFSGRAEVKCPKCGKMNVIGVSCSENI